jgi:hypothetical protein
VIDVREDHRALVEFGKFRALPMSLPGVRRR